MNTFNMVGLVIVATLGAAGALVALTNWRSSATRIRDRGGDRKVLGD